MIALEFKGDHESELISELYKQCVQEGFIVAKRPGINVFRLDPPLIIQKENIDDFLDKFDHIMSEIG